MNRLAVAALVLALFPTAASAAPAPVTTGGEQVEIELPPSVVFQVFDVRGGPVTARAPFPLAWRGARLAAGNTLRISVRLETPDARLAFRGSGPRGGTCGNGHLTPGAFIRVFDSAAGATSGGCDLLWQLDTLGAVKRSGRYAVALRWKIESVGLLAGFGTLAAPPGASAAAAATASPPAAGSAAAAHSASGLPPDAAALQATASGGRRSHGAPPPPMPRRAPPG
jgi:hypothetical protein